MGLQKIAEHLFLILVSTFVLVAVWEMFSAGRPLSQPIVRRWACNLSFSLLDGGIAKILTSLTGIALASFAAAGDYGLFNQLHPPPLLSVAASVVALDFLQYWLHRGMHGLRWLWFIHRVHHSDLDFDVSTGFRFHPLEILLLMLPRAAAILLLGIPVLGVVLHGMLVFLSNCFQHANIATDRKWMRALESVLVTPAMHGVHHSTCYAENNSNYGTLFSFWDRLFSTYRNRSGEPASSLHFGLDRWQDPGRLGFLKLLIMPFHAHEGRD